MELSPKIFKTKNGFNYTWVLYFEKKFFDDEFVDPGKARFRKYWPIVFVYFFVYIVAIFSGLLFMKYREKFDMRNLIAWNLVLALFSILGAIRLWPEFIAAIYRDGIEHNICTNDFTYGVTACWMYLFVISKFSELLDTFFIVIRKQNLIFLHRYHHATVLIYSWFSIHDFYSSTGSWFGIINFTIHGAMYSYYTLKALRFNIPKWVNIVITSSQLSQMVIGLYVNIKALKVKLSGKPCGVSYENPVVFYYVLFVFCSFCIFFL